MEERVYQTLRQLIAFDTSNPPGNEQGLAQHIAKEMEAVGFSTQLPSCGEGRASVVATKQFGPGKKLVLNGHLDVVPAVGKWASDPFCAEIRNGRMYGRGTADMKGGVAAMMEAARRICDRPDGITGTLALNFVADEEIINLGTHSCKLMWQDADYVVIGEPTQLQIQIAHRGTIRYRITFVGQSCHSSNPDGGHNAVAMAAHFVDEVGRWNEQLRQRTHPVLPGPTVAVTTIEGGEKDNIIPDRCAVCFDRRIIPGETPDQVEQELQQVLQRTKQQMPDLHYEMERYICLASGSIDMDSPLCEMAQQVYQQCFDKQAVVCGFPATCEQCIFTNAGIPTMIFGPGSIAQAHIVDEYVELEQLDQAVAYYEALIRTALAR